MLAASIHEHAGLGNQLWRYVLVVYSQRIMVMILVSVILAGEVSFKH